jgi:hypothetical protein
VDVRLFPLETDFVIAAPAFGRPWLVVAAADGPPPEERPKFEPEPLASNSSH